MFVYIEDFLILILWVRRVVSVCSLTYHLDRVRLSERACNCHQELFLKRSQHQGQESSGKQKQHRNVLKRILRFLR